MDEILIEEKKYISSKRAAKVTGYAKDYVGQLCREGRVPARLVGRSWYVLESAIQDHRFGDTSVPSESVSSDIPMRKTWAAPHYEASNVELLPLVNRLREEPELPNGSTNNKESEFSQHLQDSWRAWFDRVGDIEPTPLVTAPEPEKPRVKEDEEVSIPIRTVYKAIYQAPPEELLPPRDMAVRPPRNEPQPIKEERKGKRVIVASIRLAGILIAAFFAITAVIGSGYFDKYIISNRQVGIIAGVIFYNR